MRNIKILKSQRAAIGKMLIDKGLAPLDFKWEEVGSLFIKETQVQSLVHTDTGFYFTFDIYKPGKSSIEKWVCPHSPDKNKPKANTATDTWDATLRLCTEWATLVKREVDAEDPWDEAAQNFGADWTASDEKFTSDEVNKLHMRLDEIKQYLLEQSDQTEASTKAIEAGIEDLKKSAQSVSKKDWVLIFMGWFFSHCATWAIGQDHWRQVVSILLKNTKTFLLQAL